MLLVDDIAVSSGWLGLDVVRKEKPIKCEAIGRVVRISKKVVVLTALTSRDGASAARLKIPRSSITKIMILKESRDNG